MIEIIFLDIDGCLTDGKIIYSQNGGEIKEFDVKDGAAIEAWLKLGKKIAIITGRVSECVSMRAKDLKIELLYQGVKNKAQCAEQILEKLDLSFKQAAAIGDYYNDISLLSKVALSFKPSDAHESLKADITLKHRGGNAAVSEMIELIIKHNNMQNEWDKLWL